MTDTVVLHGPMLVHIWKGISAVPLLSLSPFLIKPRILLLCAALGQSQPLICVLDMAKYSHFTKNLVYCLLVRQVPPPDQL